MGETPSRRWPRSIRFHLLVLVAALGIPLLGVQIWASSHAVSAALDAAGGNARAKSDAIAGQVAQYMRFSETLLARSSVTQARRALETGDCTAPGFVREGNRVVATLTLVNRTPEIVCSSLPVLDAARTVESGLVARTIDAGEFQIGSPASAPPDDELFLPLGMPVRDATGAVAGVLLATIALTDDPFFSEMDFDSTDVVTLATSDRIVLARWPNGDSWLGSVLPSRTPDTDQGTEPLSRGPDDEGVDRVWGQTQLDHGWVVEVGVPADAALRPELASARRTLGVVLLVILIAVGLATLSYRRIRAGLDDLAARIRANPNDPPPATAPDTPTEVADVIEYLEEVTRLRDEAVASEQKALDRYRGLFENVVFGVGRTTRDGRFLEANEALAKILGYDTPEALIAAGPLAVHRSPEARNEAIDAAGDGVFRHIDEELIRADGSPVHVRVDGRVYTDENGERIIEGIVQDISDEKLAEARLRQSQKMEAVGQLAGGIAHDFNNLLTAIGGSIDSIDAKLGPSSAVEADLDQVREGVERATSLTRQLLSFARREPGDVGPIDIQKVLADSERLLERLIGANYVLATDFSRQRYLVAIEADELQQVVMNLVLNSRDALPDGGRISISTEGRVVDGREGVVLTVRDAGMGMHAETQKRLFEPFYSTKSTGEGTGLGMSIVYGIVQRAEGTIEVESAPFKGTTIEVWLPVGERPEPVPIAVEEAELPAAGSEHILVVEDDNPVRLFVHRALVEQGYQVTAEADGLDALNRARELDQPVDLVLTDVVMPRMSGPDLGNELQSIWPSTPILYMSGYFEHDLKTATRGDPRLLLTKPFRAHELCARVREVLDEYAPDSG